MSAPGLPFDDRDGFIWYDGRLVPWRDAKLHVLTHGLHYASCVFEGERVYGGTVFRLEDHNQRLINSAKILGFEIPASMDDLRQATQELIAANKIVEGYVRPIAWRGAEQMGVSAQDSKIHLALAAWDWPAYFSPEARAKGIRMLWSRWARPAPHTAPVHAKASGLYMICTMAKHEAEAQGCDDALMLDWRGRLAEGTGAGHRPGEAARHQGRRAGDHADRARRGRRSLPDRIGRRGHPGRRDYRHGRPLPLHPGHDLPPDVGGLRPAGRQEGGRHRSVTCCLPKPANIPSSKRSPRKTGSVFVPGKWAGILVKCPQVLFSTCQS